MITIVECGRAPTRHVGELIEAPKLQLADGVFSWHYMRTGAGDSAPWAFSDFFESLLSRATLLEVILP